MNKHQNLNSVDLQNAAEVLTAKVKGKEDKSQVGPRGQKESEGAMQSVMAVQPLLSC